MTQAIRTSLWFDDQLEEAVALYTDVFPNSEIIEKTYVPDGHPGSVGSLLAVAFKLNGVEFIAINGGPMFKFTEAISLEIKADTQEEIDHYWNRLTEGGEESECGWLKDRFGLSWQVVPTILHELFRDPDPARVSRAMDAMFKMQKLDIATLIAAADGTA